MNTDPLDFPDKDNDVAREVARPLEEQIAKDDEKLKKLDETIREAERTSEPILHPKQ